MENFFIKDYFWLKEDGLDGIELYNVKDSSVIIRLSKEEGDIFNKLLHGASLESFKDSVKVENVKKIILTNGIGRFERKYYIENEYKVGRTGEMNIFEMTGQLYKAYIEIPSKCDKCNYCDKLISAPCLVCHKTKQNNIKVEKYNEIINELMEYGCKELVLHGANILEESLTFEIIEIAETCGLGVKLVIHNKMINDNNIALLNGKTNVQIVVNFDVINDDDKNVLVKDIIGTVDKLGMELDRIKISLRVDKKMCKYLEGLKQEIENKGYYIINVSVVSDEIISEVEIENIYEIKSYIYEINKLIKRYNTCMYGAIALDVDLNVLPCPHMRDYILRTNNGINNTESSLLQMWTLTKDKLEHCKDCSRKYRCLDCRALEVSYTKKVVGKRECEYFNKYI